MYFHLLLLRDDINQEFVGDANSLVVCLKMRALQDVVIERATNMLQENTMEINVQ